MPSDEGDGQAFEVTWLTLAENPRPIGKAVTRVFTCDHALLFQDFHCPLKFANTTIVIFSAFMVFLKLKSWGILEVQNRCKTQIPG